MAIVVGLIVLVCGIWFGRNHFAGGSPLPEKWRSLSSSQQLGRQSLSLPFLNGADPALVVHFWATWCAPCAEELPAWVAWIQADPSRRGIAVSLDDTAEKALKVLPPEFLDATQIVWVLDPKRAVAESWGTFQLPESYLIKPDGSQVQKWVGPQAWGDQ